VEIRDDTAERDRGSTKIQVGRDLLVNIAWTLSTILLETCQPCRHNTAKIKLRFIGPQRRKYQLHQREMKKQTDMMV
jgi:hypothetical protein